MPIGGLIHQSSILTTSTRERNWPWIEIEKEVP
jgi:hypothetical protein